MTSVKQRAVELINRMPDDKVVYIIKYLQQVEAKPQDLDDGSLAYLFQGYVDDNIREPLVDFGEATGNEKW